jgi:hypothetical protein
MDPAAIVVTALLSFAGGVVLMLGTEGVRRERSAAGRLRGLRRELVENIARIGPLDGTERGFPGAIKSAAWEAAVELRLPEDLETLLAAAYVSGAAMNNRIALVDSNFTAAGGAFDFTTTAGQQAQAHQKALSSTAIMSGITAKDAFEKARDALKELEQRDGRMDSRPMYAAVLAAVGLIAAIFAVLLGVAVTRAGDLEAAAINAVIATLFAALTAALLSGALRQAGMDTRALNVVLVALVTLVAAGMLIVWGLVYATRPSTTAQVYLVTYLVVSVVLVVATARAVERATTSVRDPRRMREDR